MEILLIESRCWNVLCSRKVGFSLRYLMCCYLQFGQRLAMSWSNPKKVAMSKFDADFQKTDSHQAQFWVWCVQLIGKKKTHYSHHLPQEIQQITSCVVLFYCVHQKSISFKLIHDFPLPKCKTLSLSTHILHESLTILSWLRVFPWFVL